MRGRVAIRAGRMLRWLLAVAAAVSSQLSWTLPTMDVTGGSAEEGDLLKYTVTLSHAVDHQVRATWATDEFSAKDGAYPLATPGADYNAGSGTLTFEPGETTKTISVKTKGGDAGDEPDEAVVVTLNELENAVFKRRKGPPRCPWGACVNYACCACGLILDGGNLPGIAVSDATAKETDSGMGFRVSLNQASESAISATFTDRGRNGGCGPGLHAQPLKPSNSARARPRTPSPCRSSPTTPTEGNETIIRAPVQSKRRVLHQCTGAGHDHRRRTSRR